MKSALIDRVRRGTASRTEREGAALLMLSLLSAIPYIQRARKYARRMWESRYDIDPDKVDEAAGWPEDPGSVVAVDLGHLAVVETELMGAVHRLPGSDKSLYSQDESWEHYYMEQRAVIPHTPPIDPIGGVLHTPRLEFQWCEAEPDFHVCVYDLVWAPVPDDERLTESAKALRARLGFTISSRRSAGQCQAPPVNALEYAKRDAYNLGIPLFIVFENGWKRLTSTDGTEL